jgi:hypothetical protein
MLVSPDPFSADDVQRLDAVTHAMRFDLVLTPTRALDATFATLAAGGDIAEFLERFPVNVAAPTDDRPFFFHTLRIRDALGRLGHADAPDSINVRAVSVLGSLLLAVVVLTALGVLLPLVIAADGGALRGAGPLAVFFAAIGVGFMLVEVSQMQRLIVFLGHPIYSLSVVLFALLVSSGIGSYLSGTLAARGRLHPVLVMVALVVALVAAGVATPWATRALAGGTTTVRIAIAAALLAGPGLLMGMAFPLGMRAAAGRVGAITPWLWGINGATSVVASVLAVVVALGAGISASFWTGVVAYGVATVALGASRPPVSA